ncbi:TetR family transcriptional regulator [Paraburkholderia xenovorans]|uniref:Transcriptional regulator, TetR family n=1 Tax=Paraburkholderia xenovorans (strain LB400) TaxID=266265 RepID=Q13HG3_PARXL|nr:TetR family transcriptional regulator [Paraburkholderia xenovorans]ABE36476.1 transcriptional regulator, TetR family [Paraburkholderia xenovorans LB400]
MNRKLQGLATREKILDAAELAFSAYGTEHTSLEDVARAALVTRGAIYGHFDDKAALLDALLKRAALPLDPFMVPVLENCDSPLERLRQDLQTRLHTVLCEGTTRRLYRILLARPMNNTIASAETLDEAGQIAQARIATALRAAQDMGEISEDIDSRHEASMIHALLTGYFRRSLLRAAESRPREQAAEVVHHALVPLHSHSVVR